MSPAQLGQESSSWISLVVQPAGAGRIVLSTSGVEDRRKQSPDPALRQSLLWRKQKGLAVCDGMGWGGVHSEEECSQCLEEVEPREWCSACLSSARGTEATSQSRLTCRSLSGRSPLSPLVSFVFGSVYFSFYDDPWLPQVNKL